MGWRLPENTEQCGKGIGENGIHTSIKSVVNKYFNFAKGLMFLDMPKGLTPRYSQSQHEVSGDFNTADNKLHQSFN